MIVLKEDVAPQIPFKDKLEEVLKNLTYQEMREKIHFYIPSKEIKYNFSDDGLGGDFEFEADYDASVDKKISYKISEDFAEFVRDQIKDEAVYQEAYDFAIEDLTEDNPELVWSFLSYFEDTYIDSKMFDEYCKETLKEYFEDKAQAEWREMEDDWKAEQQMRRDSYYW